MRVLAIIVLGVQCTFLRAQFSDSFSDGDLDKDPAWSYNKTDFEVLNGRMHSRNPGGGSVQFGIGTLQTAINPEYFSLELELGINPSSTNYLDYFIAADSFPLNAKNGYFLRLGDTRDNITLYSLQNGTKTALISGRDGALNYSTNKLLVRLVKNGSGEWKLYRYHYGNGTWKTEGSIQDTFRFNGKYCGIKIQQSGTTAAGKHFADDIYIGKNADTVAPKILQIIPTFPDKVDVLFQKPIANTDVNNFQLDGAAIPQSAWIDTTNEAMVHLQFAKPFQWDKKYFLWVQNNEDLFGKKSTLQKIPFLIQKTDTPLAGDLIFSEVMANPAPSVGSLPEDEYLEIVNISKKRLALSGCTFGDASGSYTIPDSVLAPGAYAVLCRKTSTLFRIPGIHCIGTGSFPSLNNDQDQLWLKNAKGEIICALNYTDKWHLPAWKKAGGWSLERTDTAMACVDEGNWSSCKTGGGTPGKRNSHAGIFVPETNNLLRIYAVDSTHIQLFFRYATDRNIASDPNHYLLNETTEKPAVINWNGNRTDLFFANAMQRNTVYNLQTIGLKSCYGEIISDAKTPFGLAKQNIDSAQTGINEILFDPKADGSDYVEIVNNSNDILDLKNLMTANRNDKGEPDQVTPLAPDGYDLLPGEYVLITTNKKGTLTDYPTHNEPVFLEINTLPTFSNDEGFVLLMNKQGNIVDEVHYSDKMHSPVLADKEGISLEKTQPQINSAISSNWTSASSSSGFGTPGSVNSQYTTIRKNDAEFRLIEKWFSPDNDGMNDLLVLQYKLPAPGYFLNATVFSENGGEVSGIFHNFTLDQQGEINWDGRYGEQTIPSGNYVLFLELFHTNGETIRKKITFSVLKKS